jgi:hypothetical protein
MSKKVTRAQMQVLRNALAPVIGANPERVIIMDHQFHGLRPGSWTLIAEEADYEWPFSEEAGECITGNLPVSAWWDRVNHYSINVYPR